MNNYILIDFYDVIIDSEERMLDRKFSIGFKNRNDQDEFHMYFNYANQHLEE